MRLDLLLIPILANLIAGCSPQVIYKCPRGQVLITEDRGTSNEKDVCYTPGVSYTDYRPLNQTQKDHF